MKGLFDRLDNKRIHHFQGRRNNARSNNAGDGLGGVVDRLKHRQKRAVGLRLTGELEGGLGHNPERAFRADGNPP